MYKDRVGRDINPGDFVAYVTAGDRHPVFEFGWVVEFRESKSYGEPTGNFKIKIQRAEPDGTRETVQVVDVAAHWRDDTPAHITDYYSGYRRTREDFDNYYVESTYRDTGRPSTTTLDICEGNNNRLLITQPII